MMNKSILTIGHLSRQTKCSVPTIRYYEEIGLLPQSERASNGHRFYRQEDIQRLLFIKRCRDFGFPIEQVRQLSQLLEDGERACVEVRDLAQSHLDEIRKKIVEMRELEKTLNAYVCACNAGCVDGQTKDCSIIETLQVPVIPQRRPEDSIQLATNPDSFSVPELKRGR